MLKPLAGIVLVLAIVYTIYEPAWTKRKLASMPKPPKVVTNYTFTESYSPIKAYAKQAKSTLKKVAVGYNTNTDLIVSATGFLDELAKTEDLSALNPGNGAIDSAKSLVESILHHFQSGAAAERLISGDKLCQTVVAAAQKVKGAHTFVGGNAALMAKTFVEAAEKLGEKDLDVLLAGSLPEDLKKLLPASIRFLPNSPQPKPEEAHVILEYTSDARWKEFGTTRANRYIVHCDKTNAQLAVAPSLNEAGKNADVLVISGLHLLAGQPSEVLVEKFKLLHEFISDKSKTSESTIIHLEMASFDDPTLLAVMASTIVPFVDSIGLNEVEGKALAGYWKMPFFGALTEAQYAAAYATLVLHYAGNEYKSIMEANTKPGEVLAPKRKLSRVHLHSLSTHVIVHADGQWEDSHVAIAAASIASTMQACGVEDIEKVTADMVTLPMIPQILGSESDQFFVPKDMMFTLRDQKNNSTMLGCPVAVCKKPIKTVGLGDTISAVGLLTHRRIFKKD